MKLIFVFIFIFQYLLNWNVWIFCRKLLIKMQLSCYWMICWGICLPWKKCLCQVVAAMHCAITTFSEAADRLCLRNDSHSVSSTIDLMHIIPFYFLFKVSDILYIRFQCCQLGPSFKRALSLLYYYITITMQSVTSNCKTWANEINFECSEDVWSFQFSIFQF